MELTAVAFENIEGVAHNTMNQPERGNPIDEGVSADLGDLANECSVGLEALAVLIDAKGRVISVGGI